MVQRVIAAALGAQRQLLVEAQLPGAPGGYLLFVAPAGRKEGGDAMALLGPYGLGTQPIYAGAAADLRERARRHGAPSSLGGAHGFELGRIWIAPVPTRTLAGALLVEGISLDTWSPPLNAAALSGLGSRQQGRRRTSTQRVSGFDHLWRRPWAGQPSMRAVCAAQLTLASRVARAPMGPSWPRLPTVSG